VKERKEGRRKKEEEGEEEEINKQSNHGLLLNKFSCSVRAYCLTQSLNSTAISQINEK
jgi:hypothetical protein